MNTPKNNQLQSIEPGRWLGMLGGGQLGRLFCKAAQEMGYKTHVLAPEENPPAAAYANQVTQADYLDKEALQHLAKTVEVVSLEFENIPAETLEYLEPLVPVRPGPFPLKTAQNRLREKTWLQTNGFATAAFYQVHGPQEIEEAINALGLPVVLKTAGFGYDGKGQRIIREQHDILQAWESLETETAIVEEWITYRSEASILAARTPTGMTTCYPLARNEHRNHILHKTMMPGGYTFSQQTMAEEAARGILEKMNYVGLLCIEFFELSDGSLIINEMAPRTHNSGHVTLEACSPSQFHTQVRAICNQELLAPEILQPGVMINLLGDLWKPEEPDWSPIEKHPNAHLHLYGKTTARPGRKMGHLTVTHESIQQAEKIANELFCAF